MEREDGAVLAERGTQVRQNEIQDIVGSDFGNREPNKVFIQGSTKTGAVFYDSDISEYIK